MTRKRILLGVIALFAVAVAGLAVAGTVMAQRDQSFAHILAQNSGDADVVAVVRSKDLTRGEVRQAADFKQTADPYLTRDAAVKSVIVFAWTTTSSRRSRKSRAGAHRGPGESLHATPSGGVRRRIRPGLPRRHTSGTASKDLTRGEVRQAADFKQTADPYLTRDAAVKSVIVFVVDDYIIEAEVESRGLVPTEDQVRAFMRPHQEACAGEYGQDCRDAIEQMGQTVDEYWANALPEYREDLGNSNLFNAVFDEQGIADDASNATLVTARDTYQANLRDQAEITWHDEELRRLYEDAKASR